MERMFIMVFIIISLTSVVMEVFFYYYCINYGNSAICLIAFYILKNIHYFMIDLLTGAYNRQMYNQALSRIERSKHCVIVFLDINDFKFINDTYGHEAGDKALILFVDILYRHLNSLADIYRVGGDEFAILSTKSSVKTLQVALDEAKLEMKQHNLCFVSGIQEYHSNDDMQETLRLADKAMYENKILMKANREVSE